KLGTQTGSGSLWSNASYSIGKKPLLLADNPVGEWNHLRILMTGGRVSVWLNDMAVGGHVLLDNSYDRTKPVPATGPVCLMSHAPMRWRNLFIREIRGEEANEILASQNNAGFASVWNGVDFENWAGPLENYEVVNETIRCKPGKGGIIYPMR